MFRLTADGQLTTLYAFRWNDPTKGWAPSNELLLGRDASLYGTTVAGGALGGGTVYRVTASGAFTLLHSFAREAGGSYALPSALAQDSRSRLYGTTHFGGPGNAGTIFRVEVP